MQNPTALSFVVVVVLIATVLWALLRLAQWSKSRGGLVATVFEWEFALRYIDGKFDGVLSPGRYVRWPFFRCHDIFTLRRTGQFELTPVVDVASKDGLVFRMSAVVGYRVVEPREAHEEGYLAKIQMAASGALVKLAAGHDLESLLSERAAMDTALKSLLDARICGCDITSVSVRSMTLPPEVRRLFAEVERAKLEGLAALERARGENAALRSLANAAGVLKGNPELMNLRILQAMSTPAGKNQLTLVVGKEGLIAGANGATA